MGHKIKKPVLKPVDFIIQYVNPKVKLHDFEIFCARFRRYLLICDYFS